MNNNLVLKNNNNGVISISLMDEKSKFTDNDVLSSLLEYNVFYMPLLIDKPLMVDSKNPNILYIGTIYNNGKMVFDTSNGYFVHRDNVKHYYSKILENTKQKCRRKLLVYKKHKDDFVSIRVNNQVDMCSFSWNATRLQEELSELGIRFNSSMRFPILSFVENNETYFVIGKLLGDNSLRFNLNGDFVFTMDEFYNNFNVSAKDFIPKRTYQDTNTMNTRTNLFENAKDDETNKYFGKILDLDKKDGIYNPLVFLDKEDGIYNPLAFLKNVNKDAMVDFIKNLPNDIDNDSDVKTSTKDMLKHFIHIE